MDALQAKLGNIQQAARWFQVLGIVLLVIGCVGLFGGTIKLLNLLPENADWGDVLSGVWSTVFDSLHYFLFAWIARRAADAFHAIAALIREMGEIV